MESLLYFARFFRSKDLSFSDFDVFCIGWPCRFPLRLVQNHPSRRSLLSRWMNPKSDVSTHFSSDTVCHSGRFQRFFLLHYCFPEVCGGGGEVHLCHRPVSCRDVGSGVGPSVPTRAAFPAADHRGQLCSGAGPGTMAGRTQQARAPGCLVGVLGNWLAGGEPTFD